MVTITFDGAINNNNIDIYEELFKAGFFLTSTPIGSLEVQVPAILEILLRLFFKQKYSDRIAGSF